MHKIFFLTLALFIVSASAQSMLVKDPLEKQKIFSCDGDTTRIFLPSVDAHFPRRFPLWYSCWVPDSCKKREFHVFSTMEDELVIKPAWNAEDTLGNREEFSLRISRWFSEGWSIGMFFYSTLDWSGEHTGFLCNSSRWENKKNALLFATRIANAVRAKETPRWQDVWALWLELERINLKP